MAVPAAWITAGTAVSADVDPANQIAESNKGNNHFSYGALSMQSVHQWKITLFPIHTTDGRTGTVETQAGRKRIWLTLRRDCIQCRTMWTWWWGRRSIRPQAEVAAVAERRNELGQGAERTTGEAHSGRGKGSHSGL